MDEEDEAVLFEGSPLHQTLVDSGMPLNDMEIQMRSKQKDMALTRRTSKKEESTGLLNKIMMKLKDILRALLHLVLPSENLSIENYYQETIVTDLLKAKVLDDDDKEFLENYLEPFPQPHGPETEQLMPWRSKLLFVFLIPSLTAYLYQRIIEEDDDWEWNHLGSMDTLALVSIFYLLLKSLNIFRNFKQRRKLSNLRETILVHAKSQLSVSVWMKRCLRLIQEAELVARGFTLVSQKSPISLIEQSHLSGVSSRQCPELRKLLFNLAKEAILLLREITKRLVINFPISQEVDAPRHHLAFQPLESYGPCLQMSANEETELYNLTDGFSIAALKGMVHLCHLHQSECIKRLILWFSNGHRSQTDFCSSLFMEEITNLTQQLQDWSYVLEKSFSFHNSYLLNREPKEKVTSENSPCRDIGIAVHSLDLHLQAALTRVRAVSSWLEKLDEESESVDTNFLSHDTVSQMMQPIKAELDSCKGCWEEGINRIERLQNRKPSVETERYPTERSTVVPKSKEDLSKIVLISDPIIVDQVFEAYTDDDHTELRDYSWEQPLTMEEKEKRKREKEEALRMLKELKSVISVRSVEMERREADALKRFRNQTDKETAVKNNVMGQSQKPGQSDETVGAATDFKNGVETLSYVAGMRMTKENTHDSRKIDTVFNINIPGQTDNNSADFNNAILSNSGVMLTKEGIEISAVEDKPDCRKPDGQNSDHCTDQHSEDIKIVNKNFVQNKEIRDDPEKTNMSDTSDFLYISDDGTQNIMNISTPRTKGLVKDGGVEADEVTSSSSEKSSSFLEIGNTDIESVYSARSYDTESIKDFEQSKTSDDELLIESDPLHTGQSERENVDCDEKVDDNIETGHNDFSDRENPLTLEERLEFFHGANLGFTSNLAALAAARSHAFGIRKETTFGDDTFGDDSDDEGEVMM